MAAHAAPHGDPESSGIVDGKTPSLPSDPLRRLEVELGEADGGRADDERLYVEAQGLVEEAWSLVTECLVLRDGLLDACNEIEQTMAGIQQRLDVLPFSHDPDGSLPRETDGNALDGAARGVGGKLPAVGGLPGAGTEVNGTSTAVNGAVNGAGAAVNGASAVNGTGPA